MPLEIVRYATQRGRRGRRGDKEVGTAGRLRLRAVVGGRREARHTYSGKGLANLMIGALSQRWPRAFCRN